MVVCVTVRVLPPFLTVTLVCFGTLTVSTFGVRSYSDHRYASMQASVVHGRGVSIARTGDVGPSVACPDGGTEASCIPGSGAGAGRACSVEAGSPGSASGAGAGVGAAIDAGGSISAARTESASVT